MVDPHGQARMFAGVSDNETASRVTAEELLYLAERASTIATSKGWDRCDWETNFVGKIALVITEVDELVESDGTDMTELADVAIRALALLHQAMDGHWVAESVIEKAYRGFWVGGNLRDQAWLFIRKHRKAIEAWRVDDIAVAAENVSDIVSYALRWGDAYGFNMSEIIGRKLAKNAARPPLHGKKRSLG